MYQELIKQRRKDFDAAYDWAKGEAAALRTVGRAHSPPFRECGSPFLGVGRLRRNPAIGWIDDERRAPLEVAPWQPEGVVVARLGVVRLWRGVPLEGVGDQLVAEKGVSLLLELPGRVLDLRDLGIGQQFFVRPGHWTLQWRGAVVAPHAFEVWMTERRLRDFVRRGWP